MDDSGKNIPVDVLDSVLRKTSEDFKDPYSTQFRKLKSRVLHNTIIVCGEINSKNSFGAYTGFQQFLSAEGKSSILLPPKSDPYYSALLPMFKDCPA
jgi:hypothetical protein